MSAPGVPTPAGSERVGPAWVLARLSKYRWALLTPVVSLAIALLTNMVASRMLGPAQFGAFSVATTTATLLGVAMGFGMPATMVRYAGRFAMDEHVARRASVRTAWRIVGITTTLAALTALTAVLLRPPALAAWIPSSTGAWIILAGLGVMVTEMAAASAQLGLRFAGYFRVVIASSALRLVGIALAMLVAGPTLGNAVAGFALGYAAAALVNGAAARRSLTLASVSLATPLPTTPTAGDSGAMLRFGVPVVASAFLVAAISAVDTLAVAATLGAAKTGWYAAAARLTIIQQLLIQGITTLALPVAIEAVRRGDAARYARRVLLLGGVSGAIVTSVLVVATPFAVQLVYGDRYAASVPLYQVYALGIAINFPGNPLSQLLYARSRPALLTLVHVAQLVALLVALPLTAHKWDVLGAATCWAIVNWCSVGTIMLLSVRVATRESTT